MNLPQRKPTVAFIVPNIYPCTTGGMEIFYYSLLSELKRKVKVYLITACTEFNDEEIVTIRFKKRLWGIPGSSRVYTLISVLFILLKHKRQINLIHFPYTSNAGRWGYMLAFVSKFFGLKYILHLHGGGMKKWKVLSGNKLLFNNADELIAVSDIIKKEYEERTKRNLRLIYPLVSFKKDIRTKEEIRKAIGYSDSDKILLFVGSLKAIKSPNTLLDAFFRLGKAYIEKELIKLILVGSGALREALEIEANNLGINQYVNFTGLIPYNEVPAYFKMADIYIIPSRFEGTPKSLLEAMYNKLPIIASDVSGINNILTDKVNALLFPANNSIHLSHCLKELIYSSSLAQNIAENAFKKYAEKYSFDEMLNKLNEIYEKYNH